MEVGASRGYSPFLKYFLWCTFDGIEHSAFGVECLFQGLLKAANQMQAEYLFQQDKAYDVSWDTGDKTIQCGRHNDIFKLWLMWRAKVSTQALTELNCISNVFSLNSLKTQAFFFYSNFFKIRFYVSH